MACTLVLKARDTRQSSSQLSTVTSQDVTAGLNFCADQAGARGRTVKGNVVPGHAIQSDASRSTRLAQ
jgi:hypothetical protein